MTYPLFSPGHIAVVTGGASGIGLDAATRFAQVGMRVCIADLGEDRLRRAASAIQASSDRSAQVIAVEADVAKVTDLRRLEEKVIEEFGGVNVLMNNAGIQPGSTMFGPASNWEEVFNVNLWGVIHGVQTFLPEMTASGRPGLVINTGSKQGITTPPGDPAYNISKAGVKAFTEALQHELRSSVGDRITAHLLIPGFVYTGLTAKGRAEKPGGAWTPEQTVDFMIDRLSAGDFYILCPDNDVPRKLDERRILWAASDIIENRPALSRWHPNYADAFARFVESESD